MKRAIEDVGDATTDLSKKTGAALGLLKKKPEKYVRFAYGPGEEPVDLVAEYSFTEERMVGRLLAVELMAHYGRYERKSLERYLNTVAAAVCAFSDRPSLPCSVGILKSENIACYGLPGGYVLVTLGALRACESESELAGMLAQALAHVHLHHSLARMERLYGKLLEKTPQKPITSASDTDFKVLVEDEVSRFVKGGHPLMDIHAADRKATDWLVRAGYEPGGLKAYLARAQLRLRERSSTGILSNHKEFEARDKVISDRLLALHAPAHGRALPDRYRRQCTARLPVPVSR